MCHAYDNVVEGLTYCRSCGIWEGAAGDQPCHPRQLIERDRLVAAVIATGKRWWPSVRAKAAHARMSTIELKHWQAIRAVMKRDEDSGDDSLPPKERHLILPEAEHLKG